MKISFMVMLFQQNKKYLYKVKTIQNVRQCLETPALLLIHYSCWKIKESLRIGYNVTVPKTSSTENCGICLHEIKRRCHTCLTYWDVLLPTPQTNASHTIPIIHFMRDQRIMTNIHYKSRRVSSWVGFGCIMHWNLIAFNKVMMKNISELWKIYHHFLIPQKSYFHKQLTR